MMAKLIIFDNDGVLIDSEIISETERKAINQKTEASYSSMLTPVKDITLVLDYLEANHIDKCVASNGDVDYMMRSLKLTGLNKYFKSDELFSGTLTNRRKPAPDVFLHAARHFNVDPKDCLVIEDHIMGIAAAKAAQMPVIGFLGASHTGSALHREELLKAGPTEIVNDALELLRILKG